MSNKIIDLIEIAGDIPSLLTGNKIITVGSGGDFSTLNDAFTEASKYHIIASAGDMRQIKILSGHVLDYGTILVDSDLSSWELVSEDAIVLSTETGNTFYTRNSKFPLINILVDLQTIGAYGIYAEDFSSVRIKGTKGFVNADYVNAYISNKSEILANGAYLYGGDSNSTAGHGNSVYVTGNSEAYLVTAFCRMDGTNANPAGVTNNEHLTQGDIHLAIGSNVVGTSCLGGTNVPSYNQLTVEGTFIK